ncbi:hypothetical protein O6H91_Y097500 [Diphasiastrum complanatum]|nr:hypothetical protein O6H91_Y097500 [Diphasiastrum complanatum]
MSFQNWGFNLSWILSMGVVKKGVAKKQSYSLQNAEFLKVFLFSCWLTTSQKKLIYKKVLQTGSQKISARSVYKYIWRYAYQYLHRKEFAATAKFSLITSSILPTITEVD